MEGLLSGSEEDRQAYLEPRHVVDVLSDFADARLSSADLLPCLRPLQPRLYSISSSPLEGPGRVQASVSAPSPAGWLSDLQWGFRRGTEEGED